jgi:hypothetical protein
MIQNIGEFDFSKVTYTSPKKSAGHYSVCAQMLDDNGMSGGKIYFQTPKMRLVADIVSRRDEASDDVCTKPFVDMSCDDETFVKSIKDFDTHMFNVIKDKRGDWFPNKTIDDTFLEMGQTPSLMINNVVRARTDKNLEIFNSRKVSVEPRNVTSNHVIRCILQFVGIWFTATRWGVTWKVVQMLHYPERKSVVHDRQKIGYMFPEDDDVSDNDDDDTPVPPPGV